MHIQSMIGQEDGRLLTHALYKAFWWEKGDHYLFNIQAVINDDKPYCIHFNGLEGDMIDVSLWWQCIIPRVLINKDV